MRIAFWLEVALLVACTPQPAHRPAPKQALPARALIATTVADAQTVFDVQRSGQHFRVPAARDAFVASTAEPVRVDVVAETANALVVVDSYASVPSGMSLCQAGEERFLRVITLSGAQAHIPLSLKLESCREEIELASPGSEWDAAAATLRIHWLQRTPGRNLPTERTVRFGADGIPTLH